MHFARPFFFLFAVALAVGPARAQNGPGPLDNAALVPGGTLRFHIGSRWSAADRRFGSPVDGGSLRQDYAGFLSSDALGVAESPTLGVFEQRIRDASSLPTFRLSLGTARVRAQSRSTAVPIGIEYGLGRRIAVGVWVPIVYSAVNMVANGNSDDSTANAGLSPRTYNEAEASRLTTLATQFSQALSQLRSRYPACFSASPGAGCGSITQLDGDARTYAALIAATYGAIAVVPAAGSAAHDSVLTRLISFNDQFRAALGLAASANPIAIRPLGALPAANAEYHRLLTDTTFGVAVDSIGPIERISVGDIEVGVTIGLLDRWTATSGPRIRSSVTAAFRAGTGRPPRSSGLLDAGTGDGQHDVEGRFALDARVARRFLTTVLARYTVQLADERFMRIPLAGVRLLPATQRTMTARDLGDEIGIDARGSFFVNSYLSGIATYGFARRGADVFTPVDATSSIAGFTSPARSVQNAGIGLAYSTLDAFARGKSWAPMEIAFLHRQAFAGSGGAPMTFSDVVELRFYAGGGRQRASR